MEMNDMIPSYENDLLPALCKVKIKVIKNFFLHSKSCAFIKFNSIRNKKKKFDNFLIQDFLHHLNEETL